MHILKIAKLLLFTMLVGCAADTLIDVKKEEVFTPSQACTQVLRSRCDATQQQLLDELLKRLGIFGVESYKQYPGRLEAFQGLPKDELGLINWSKAYADGLIKPHGTLDGTAEKPYEGYLENLILMQAEVAIMADVVFPHGMHSNMMSCNSCHPKPFKKIKGGNKIKMKEIFNGKWCGKCHGTVAFPTKPYSTCWRCHVFPKKPM